MDMDPSDGRAWIGEGLRFACTRCGRCCEAPGYVWVDLDEVQALAAHLGLSTDGFGRRYLRRAGGRLSLIENADGRCVFLGADRRCAVYAARPRQCRAFPFWPVHVESPEAWAKLGDLCPGAGRGPMHPRAEIEPLLGPHA